MSDLFPDIPARICTFYLTRLQFSHYLYFLTDVGAEVCENTSIQSDAQRYGGYCDALLGDIVASPFDDVREMARVTGLSTSG